MPKEGAFVNTGFKNWKKGAQKLQDHSKSEHHKHATETQLFQQKGPHVKELISSNLKQCQQESKRSMLTVISSLRYLALSGQSIRGHEAETSNLRLLLHERASDVPALKEWFNKRDNWLSGDIQNELLEIMAHSVQRNLLKSIHEAPFFSIIADGTTDLSGMEQFSVCIRYTNKQLEPQEVFLGMYNAPDSTAMTLYRVIRDVAVRCCLDMKKLRAHCFDGAANMSGRFHGVTAELSSEHPKSVYVHCANHSLDLVLQEAAKECDVICNALVTVKDISNMIRESSKRRGIYNDTEDDTADTDPVRVTQLISMCPTRWAIRVKAVERFIDNFHRTRETLNTLCQEREAVRGEARAKIRGFVKKMSSFELMFGLMVAKEVLGPCEHLAKKLQGFSMTATGALICVQQLITSLRDMRNPDEFERILSNVVRNAEKLQLSPPKSPRLARPPLRLEHTENPADAANLNATENMRKQYYEVLDLLCAQLERRFDQPGMIHTAQIESILLDSACGKN